MVVLQKKARNSGFFITIPKILVQSKGWKKGQKLDLRYNEKGNIEIFEVK